MNYYPTANPLDAMDWQRSNADILKAWLSKQDEWTKVNHDEFWESWWTDVFDLRTCNDFGLSVWSIILDESTFGVTEASGEDYPAWGFGEYRYNFNNGNFGTNDDSGYNFSTDEKRVLLQLKAYILHMSGCIHGEGVIGINEALNRIFGEDAIYCIDNRDMSLKYILFDTTLTSLVYEIYDRDLLPTPVGMKIDVVLDGNAKNFGFGTNHSNFNNGNFYTGELIEG